MDVNNPSPFVHDSIIVAPSERLRLSPLVDFTFARLMMKSALAKPELFVKLTLSPSLKLKRTVSSAFRSDGSSAKIVVHCRAKNSPE
jgi:hypothetical protein